MTQNTTINATVNAAANVAEKKEENVMMNLTQKELEAMKVVELKDLAQQRGLTFTSKTKKAELVAMLKPYTTGTPSQYRKGEVDHIVVEVPVGDLSITKDTMEVKEDNNMDDNKKKEKNRVALALVVAWVYQSTHSVTNDNRVLFYIPTKRVDLKGVKIASRKRLSKVTGDLLGWMYGKELKDETFRKWVDSAYDVALEAGLCHKNGDDIHMSVEEWNKCVNFYNKDYMKDSIKKYAAFVTSKK